MSIIENNFIINSLIWGYFSCWVNIMLIDRGSLLNELDEISLCSILSEEDRMMWEVFPEQ